MVELRQLERSEQALRTGKRREINRARLFTAEHRATNLNRATKSKGGTIHVPPFSISSACRGALMRRAGALRRLWRIRHQPLRRIIEMSEPRHLARRIAMKNDLLGFAAILTDAPKHILALRLQHPDRVPGL